MGLFCDRIKVLFVFDFLLLGVRFLDDALS